MGSSAPGESLGKTEAVVAYLESTGPSTARIMQPARIRWARSTSSGGRQTSHRVGLGGHGSKDDLSERLCPDVCVDARCTTVGK
jgi:hypothetical protein